MAFAKPGGEPLVLDTQTGIHSGVPGTVLQSGTLGGPGMVQMQIQPQSPNMPRQYGNGGNGGRHRPPRTTPAP